LNDDTLPDWLGRQLLHSAALELRIPWDAAALVRGPGVAAMTPDENLEAIDLSLHLVAEMRRMLPRGVPGAAIDQHWLAIAYHLAAWAIVRRQAPGLNDNGDDDTPAQAVVERDPAPRGPQPGGGAVAVEIVPRKGGRRVPR
jgi:hypothetical protein